MSGEQYLCNMVLGSGHGSASSAYAVSKVWVWPYKSLLADISYPSCLFPQEHLSRETGLLGSRPGQGFSWDRPPVQRSGHAFLRASLVLLISVYLWRTAHPGSLLAGSLATSLINYFPG